LRKLPIDEVIENFISIIDRICEKDEDFSRATHEIVTHVQVRELLNGTKPDLSGYEPERKLELFKELLKFSGDVTEVSDDVTGTLLKDFEASKKTFSDWWLQRGPLSNLFFCGVKSIRELSDLEAELLELLRCGTMTLKEIEKINPRFVGALGNLKCMGLVIIEKLPNKERRIFAKKPY